MLKAKQVLIPPTCTEQVIGKATAGDIFGEIGVLYCRPQPFTARTSEISQILRLSRTSLINTIQANMEDGHIIMNNLFKVNIGIQAVKYYYPLFIAFQSQQ